MAEARSAFVVSQSIKQGGVNLNVDEDGVHFNINCTIPRTPVLRRMAARAWFRFRNRLINGTYPLGPIALLLFVAAIVTTTVTVPRDSWFRTGAIAEIVWQVSLYFPWLEGFPLTWRVGILAFYTALVFFFIFVFLQRFILRMLFSYHGFLYAARGSRPLHLQLWGLAVKLLSGRKPMMYSFSSSIPSLPVPALKDTCERYLTSVKPLQSAEQFAKTQALVEAFQKQEGPKLQRYLHLKRFISTNYVTDWWEKYCYLRGRDPICINSNYYTLDSAYVVPTSNQCARIGKVMSNILAYKQLVDREQIKPMLLGGLVPLCMEQHKRMFSTTRIPGRETDVLKHWDSSYSRHIVVLYHGHYYKMDVYRPKTNGNALTARELEEHFLYIKADADRLHAADEGVATLAALTGGNRTRWAEAREGFLSQGLNYASLHTIESAIAVVVLDDDEPSNMTEMGHMLIHGKDGTDRWFDKSLTMVAFSNGRFGMNVEHSWADAPVVAHMLEHVLLTGDCVPGAYQDDGRTHVEAPSGKGPPRKPTRLRFELDIGCRDLIDKALTEVRALSTDFDLQVFEFNTFGKGFMKGVNVSPDAFIQAALQLAYYRDIGTFHLTYESSMTRLFRMGRTETIRPVTGPMVAFVHAMEDESSKDEEVVSMLRDVAELHVKNSKDSMVGKGIDRHLFALYIVGVGLNVDSPFLKAALTEPWRLSTSQQPQQQTTRWNLKNPEHAKRISPGGGFGPVADDGYGVSYMVAGEDKVFFHVSCKQSCDKTNAARFADRIAAALRDMQARTIAGSRSTTTAAQAAAGASAKTE